MSTTQDTTPTAQAAGSGLKMHTKRFLAAVASRVGCGVMGASVIIAIGYLLLLAHHAYTEPYRRAGYEKGVVHGACYMEQERTWPSASWVANAYRYSNVNRDWPVNSVRMLIEVPEGDYAYGIISTQAVFIFRDNTIKAQAWTPKIGDRVQTTYRADILGGPPFVTTVTNLEHVGSRSQTGILVYGDGLPGVDSWWVTPAPDSAAHRQPHGE